MSVLRLALVGVEAESQAAVAALGLTNGRLAPAVVISDREDADWIALPATPAARRLAARLAHDATGVCARGRLVWVRPPREELVRVARRVAARAGIAVVALSRPRDEVADVLLAESLRVVVLADPAGPVAELALAQLAAIGVLAEAREDVAGRSVALARIGWAVSAPAALGVHG